MYVYSAFGLFIACDMRMPELVIAKQYPAIDLIIRAESVPSDLNHDGNHTPVADLATHDDDVTTAVLAIPGVQGNQQQLLLNIDNIARFLIQHGREIIYQPYPGIDEDSVRLFLLGSCMGAILQQRGFIVLHGNAITRDKQTCTIFVGHSGAGKSTSAGQYLLNGAFILADDVCAITFDRQGVPMVIPSFPQIKLWQDSADLLGISTQNLRRVRPEYQKFVYRSEEQFCAQPLPLQRVVEIMLNNDNVKMTTLDKLKCLITHSYRAHYLQTMQLIDSYRRLLLKLVGKIEITTADRENLINVL